MDGPINLTGLQGPDLTGYEGGYRFTVFECQAIAGSCRYPITRQDDASQVEWIGCSHNRNALPRTSIWLATTSQGTDRIRVSELLTGKAINKTTSHNLLTQFHAPEDIKQVAPTR